MESCTAARTSQWLISEKPPQHNATQMQALLHRTDLSNDWCTSTCSLQYDSSLGGTGSGHNTACSNGTSHERLDRPLSTEGMQMEGVQLEGVQLEGVQMEGVQLKGVIARRSSSHTAVAETCPNVPQASRGLLPKDQHEVGCAKGTGKNMSKEQPNMATAQETTRGTITAPQAQQSDGDLLFFDVMLMSDEDEVAVEQTSAQHKDIIPVADDDNNKKACSSSLGRDKLWQQQTATTTQLSLLAMATHEPLLSEPVRWRTYTSAELPDWLHDNDFLLAWHRPQLNSFARCLRTVFRLHTETGNIWSHLLGATAVIVAIVVTLTTLRASIYDYAVFAVFLITACCCFAMSTTFHTFQCHSRNVARALSKVDYCGIAMLTVGSFVPWLYYAFYCDGTARVAYLAAITILGGATVVLYTWDSFSEPRYRVVRAVSFVAAGLSGLVPAAHVLIVHGLDYAAGNLSIGWLGLMALLYITGAAAYAARVPERWLPGKFDLVLHSHQWLHVFSIAAVFVHLHGLRMLADYRVTNSCISSTEAPP